MQWSGRLPEAVTFKQRNNGGERIVGIVRSALGRGNMLKGPAYSRGISKADVAAVQGLGESSRKWNKVGRT